MNSITELKFDILASLFAEPCSGPALCQRDFCKKFAPYIIHIHLMGLVRDGLVKQTKRGQYKAYRTKARKLLNEKGYEL